MTRTLASFCLALMLAAPGLAPSAAAQEDTPQIQQMSLGEEDAPVTVVEYASFTCPHCRAFHLGPFQELKADYIDTGKIEFVMREVYFDRFGLWAAMLARCGGGADRYFEMVDMIFENQEEWMQGEPAAIADNLRRLGRSSGLSNEQIDACLQNDEKAQALVAEYQQNAEADGVDSTPSFLIDGELHRNMPYEEFSALLDEELAE